ncbi:MAG: 50S ribosomal protein L27 [Candidatus Blackburnbacteria bacterium RIFCSPHIGHO2_01_FULL_44_64]|uniref:Large ribosomal subunit protein bL27 n=1 Tax=Candidatus Blackburnbacteria bacterium RIFCSPHIGHO2_02_FULL_44_20 TaxID=1797516 RepID=A0A1G1V4V7_9BACT|nr:MAG: 50S ribosomal protein L27 [Candidatus Blackburnbacteria bacterium RIFCSPHIGHO2_01_FULL_44_64]OGY10397.1 MAG: 50S ribosomal protein L27 [Candidatus Blackburnbacteria bacterium RIFCSPHIGHO2_02_FULL_44_20]OGY12093.1 MAG: 50S ribosomal protein L27 [Candidatus Blackburnbacteria bacterium RIFCSPHIGHO2_12_FULL_44_25]OGY13710.1 MAG: 50S ribosomal protein L27 [Candidatus Blackburnbacteria bacterium RIFCSPLOWO2_01_FULL_44_43]
MAKKKAGGKVRQKGNRRGKSLGLKISGGEKVSAGSVLIRQRGTKFHAGDGVKVGRDHTLYATVSGSVKFKTQRGSSVVAVG